MGEVCATMERQNGSKNQRILKLYASLMDGSVVSKAQEAVRYGVSEKSIQRDLDDIKEFMADQGLLNGEENTVVYDRRERGYRLERRPETKFTDAEILAVSKILLDSRALTKPEMMGILDKLIDNCVSPDKRKMVGQLIANEKFHYVEPHHGTIFMDKMWELGNAIRECRVIEIDYAKLKNSETVRRVLQPLALMFSEYYFYLAAFIQNIDRETEFDNAQDPFPTIYRLDRIRSLRVTDAHFKIPYRDRFEEGEFRKRIQFMYGGRMRTVKFEYSGPSVEAVLDRLPTAKILSEDGGKWVIQAEVFGNGIDMWLRSQGGYVNVLEG